jgi:hypothetical protein
MSVSSSGNIMAGMGRDGRNAWFAIILLLTLPYQLTDGHKMMTNPGVFDEEVVEKTGERIPRQADTSGQDESPTEPIWSSSVTPNLLVQVTTTLRTTEPSDDEDDPKSPGSAEPTVTEYTTANKPGRTEKGPTMSPEVTSKVDSSIKPTSKAPAVAEITSSHAKTTDYKEVTDTSSTERMTTPMKLSTRIIGSTSKQGTAKSTTKLARATRVPTTGKSGAATTKGTDRDDDDDEGLPRYVLILIIVFGALLLCALVLALYYQYIKRNSRSVNLTPRRNLYSNKWAETHFQDPEDLAGDGNGCNYT